ncbi:MAG: hypothetical protein AB1585_03440 [Thermodesulfobacteriota bacterium]
MQKPPFESMEQMAEFTAGALSEACSHSAFALFQETPFRREAGFDRINQQEQDRIFNELVVAHLVLIMLLLEAPDLRVDEDFRGYFKILNQHIPKAYGQQLKKLGVEGDYLKDWEKLISLRYEEYARDRHEVRSAAMQLESAEKPLDLQDLSKIQLLLPAQTVAIGCHHHICRGKTEGRDELFKIQLESLSKFYVQFRVHFEGGKITPLTRAKVALKQVIRRKKKKRRK